MSFPEAPPNLKSIQPYLKIAIEHDQRDFVGEWSIDVKIFKLHKLDVNNKNLFFVNEKFLFVLIQ